MAESEEERKSLVMKVKVESEKVGKDSDTGRDWGQEEKGTTEDEMAGWHHWLDEHESEWTPGVSDGQGGMECCDSWGHKELDTSEQLIWYDLMPLIYEIGLLFFHFPEKSTFFLAISMKALLTCWFLGYRWMGLACGQLRYFAQLFPCSKRPCSLLMDSCTWKCSWNKRWRWQSCGKNMWKGLCPLSGRRYPQNCSDDICVGQNY